MGLNNRGGIILPIVIISILAFFLILITMMFANEAGAGECATPMGGSGFQLPTARGTVTDTFGTRGGSHAGIDFQGHRYGLPVYPVYPGEVIRTGWIGGYGNTVIIKHEINGRTYHSLYAHLSRIYVRETQTVGYDTRIGHEGRTGNVIPGPGGTGIHVHFEWRDCNQGGGCRPVNPTIIFPGLVHGFSWSDQRMFMDGDSFENPVCVADFNNDELVADCHGNLMSTQEWLARITFFEARGEGDLGQQKVVNVILNRARSSHGCFPDTVPEVIAGGHPSVCRILQFEPYGRPEIWQRWDQVPEAEKNRVRANVQRVMAGQAQFSSQFQNALYFRAARDTRYPTPRAIFIGTYRGHRFHSQPSCEPFRDIDFGATGNCGCWNSNN